MTVYVDISPRFYCHMPGEFCKRTKISSVLQTLKSSYTQLMTCGLSLIACAVASAWDALLCPWPLLCRAPQAIAQARLCASPATQGSCLWFYVRMGLSCASICFLPVCHQVWIYVCLSHTLGNSAPESQDTKKEKKTNKTYCTEKCVLFFCGVVQTCQLLDPCSRPPVMGFLP